MGLIATSSRALFRQGTDFLRLGINYSPEAGALVREGRLPVDLFKCPPWPAVIAEAREILPVYVHHDLMCGQGVPPAPGLDAIDALRRETKTPYVNAHLAPRTSDEIPRVGKDLATLVNRFGAENVILENSPWEKRPDFSLVRAAADPAFLSEVLEATDAMLLLDLAHVRIASRELHDCEHARALAHPTNRLRELHVTGVGRDSEGRLRDSMPMQDPDWDLLDWALERIAADEWARPWVVTLEYGGVGPHFEWRSDRVTMARDINLLAGKLSSRGLRGE